MPGIAYLNGAFSPIEQASIPLTDRGFVFGDGVYEVSAVLGGRLVDNDAHLARLDRSLAAIELSLPISSEQLKSAQRELIHRNTLTEGIVYIQVTRGPAERDFAFPANPRPTVVMFTQPRTILNNEFAERGVNVASAPDLRWARRDIKSICLLPQVMAKQHAARAGAFEALLIKDGYVTEGGASNIFFVSREQTIVTRPLSPDILAGITRMAILRLAREDNLRIDERAFTLDEMQNAAEAFLTSAANIVVPIVSVDGRSIASGRPGPIARRLRAIYFDFAVRSALSQA